MDSTGGSTIKPSTRLTQERLAAGKSEIRNPKSEIDKDLDWIVMKALEKDRARRYESSTAFAQDIQRFLHEEPVVARPPSTTYRTLKFVRKHRAAVLVAGVFIVGLVTATIVSTALALWARREQGRAEKATTQATLNERKALDASKAARESEEEARTVLGFFKDKVLAAARPEDEKGGLGWNVTLREALDSAEPSIANVFTNRPLIEAKIRAALGDSYFTLGLYTNAIPQFERELALMKINAGPEHADTLFSMNFLAACYAALGRPTEALKLYEETLPVAKAKLGSDHHLTLEIMHNVASSYMALGRPTEALKLSEEALALTKAKLGPDHPDTLMRMNSLANSYAGLGQHNDALKLREETLALRKSKLGPDHHNTATSMNNLALSYMTLGRPTDALKLFEEALAIKKAKLGPDHRSTLNSMDNLASNYDKLGRDTEALKLREETLALKKTKLGPDHPDTLLAMNNLAVNYTGLGRHNEALKLHEETLALLKTKLGPDHPDTLKSMYNLANGYAALGLHDDAIKLHEETLAARRTKLGLDHPDTLKSLSQLATGYLSTKRFAEAETLLREFSAAQRKVLPSGGTALAGTLDLLGGCLLKQDKHAQAAEVLQESVALYTNRVADDWRLFKARMRLGTALLGQQKFSEAETELLQGYDGLKRRQDKIPERDRARHLNEAAAALVKLYTEWGKPAQAEEWRKKLPESGNAPTATPSAPEPK